MLDKSTARPLDKSDWGYILAVIAIVMGIVAIAIAAVALFNGETVSGACILGSGTIILGLGVAYLLKNVTRP